MGGRAGTVFEPLTSYLSAQNWRMKRAKSGLPHELCQGGASQLMTPLVEALRCYVISTEKLPGNHAPIPVLAPCEGKTKTPRLKATWNRLRASAAMRPPPDLLVVKG